MCSFIWVAALRALVTVLVADHSEKFVLPAEHCVDGIFGVCIQFV
jgi:hypothetical protein